MSGELGAGNVAGEDDEPVAGNSDGEVGELLGPGAVNEGAPAADEFAGVEVVGGEIAGDSDGALTEGTALDGTVADGAPPLESLPAVFGLVPSVTLSVCFWPPRSTVITIF